ncbi:hypothetical protein K438DRAFT_1278078 [Mycena galopus ATCC 62051]|nr:hypothetical protein K438DRAFT_1278078 [Mycena galopus ATCC 62051]
MHRWVQEDYAASRYRPHPRVHQRTLDAAPCDASETISAMASNFDFHERACNVSPTHSTWTPPFTQSDDTWTNPPSTHYPLNAHLFPPRVGAPPIYAPVPPSTHYPPNNISHPNILFPVVPAPLTFAWHPQPPMRTHDIDGYNSVYPPLLSPATLANDWYGTAAGTPVVVSATSGVPPTPPLTRTDHSRFIDSPPSDYPTPPNGGRSRSVPPNPRRRRRHRRHNSNNVADTAPPIRKENLKRAQTNGDSASRPTKRFKTGAPSAGDRRGEQPMQDELAAGNIDPSTLPWKFNKISVSGGIGGSGGPGGTGGGHGGTGTGPEFNFHFHCSDRDRDEDSSR